MNYRPNRENEIPWWKMGIIGFLAYLAVMVMVLGSIYIGTLIVSALMG